MNSLIKKILNCLCIMLTRLINCGQHLMCFKESHSLWHIPDGRPSAEVRSEFKRNKEYLKKYGFRANKRDFYVFRNYLVDKGNDPVLIVPAYIVHSYLTSVFNPISCNAYFEDKNMFDRILPPGHLPTTYLRKIHNLWYDRDYNKIDNPIQFLNSIENDIDIIIKPARNSSSGKGIELFSKEGGSWINIKTREKLELNYIKEKWKNVDLIIQEVIKQNQFFRRFCDSAVNTLRIVIYNSPINDEKHLIWSGLRIGKSGSLVDNTHAGGLMFGVSEDGHIAGYGADQYGNKYTVFNGVDFADESFVIDNFNEIISLCMTMASYLLPHRFIAFDVAVSSDGTPLIIEYNLRAYGGWACQFAGDPMFGEKTDEILQYLSTHKKEGLKFFYSIN